MDQTFSPLSPSPRLLLGPGPSQIAPRVLRACATPLLGYLDAEYLRMMDDVQTLLRMVMGTKNDWTMCVPGTGMAGMEAALVNVVEPGDQVLVCVAGAFGERMVDLATRMGGVVSRVDAEWGTMVQPEQVKEALKTLRPKVVCIVNAETSTGVLQPLAEIGKLAHEAGALFLVDCVTSLGGMPVNMDAMGVDVLYSGTQKCLGAPPSLAPISFSPAAVEVYRSRKTVVPSFYLDAGQIWRYWGPERGYHQTGMVNMLYALREALVMISEEGLEARFARHRQNQKALVAGAEAMGLELAVKDPALRLPSLTTILIPEGVDDATVRRNLINQYGIEIGSGMGKFAGKAWRVGLMGYASQRANVMLLLAALGDLLKNERVDEGLAAASAAYAAA
ncbi:MAG: pyridoxal-phosphate-dependent aminotransferase family protein [Anaerolineae bacterium]|jgi:alanine-glyoxylate transaminase/serine-glyoxylate transaminase/serine-pyruvate transaminase|nr:alanine--glyoxylate aminotransferase family protein [Chloroflexota bacterium]